MKLEIFVLLLGSVSAISASVEAEVCSWSDCQDYGTPGQLMCDINGLGEYSGKIDDSSLVLGGCWGFFRSRVECCTNPNSSVPDTKPVSRDPVPIMPVFETDCEWSQCHNPVVDGQLICDLKGLGNYTKGKLSNSSTDGCPPKSSRVECCITRQTDCQWSDCHGLTTPGTLMCELKGSDLYYKKESSGNWVGGCGWDSSRVECCPSNGLGPLALSAVIIGSVLAFFGILILLVVLGKKWQNARENVGPIQSVKDDLEKKNPNCYKIFWRMMDE